jgi:hypothetical protein
MARRLFGMIDIVELLQHWYSGRSKTDVAASLGIDRGTIRKYVAPAETAGMTPGGTPVSRAEWAVLAADWFPELLDAKVRSLTYAEINVHRERIVTMLATNRPATVWQRLRDEHGLAVGLTSFRRYVWLEFPDEVTADDATVLRPDVEPGSEAQIDYGYLGLWPDPVVGPESEVECVRDGARDVSSHVRSSGAVDGPDRVDRRACRSVQIFWWCTGALGA